MKRPTRFQALIPLVGIAVIAGVVWQVASAQPSTPELPSPPLRELAERKNIDMGNFAIRSRLQETPYTDILKSQFNLALVDNQPNWHFTDHSLRPSPTTYDFKHIDEVVDFAETNNMKLEFHHFVWGEEKWLPDWLKNGKYSKQQLLDIMRDHIMTVGKRYAGKADHWTVVNEAFNRNAHTVGLRDWWIDNIGDMSFIDQAFIWAREADPNAKLILNDFGNEGYNDISNAMYDYIKGAKARGVPIDGLGMQMHIDGRHPPTKDEVISNMRRFGDLGVKVYVTEFDVNMHDVKTNPRDKNEIEAEIYHEMARACIESKVCPSFAVLGITDKETWYNYMGLTGAQPLPFTKDYEPKPAFFSLRRAFEEQ